MSSSDNAPLHQSSPVLVVPDNLANLAIQPYDSSPTSQTSQSLRNHSDSRPSTTYSRSLLSPLARLPYSMPALKDWFRSENDQSNSKKDPETPLAVSNPRDRQFRRDTDDGGPVRQSFCVAAITQPSQMGNFNHQSIRATDRDWDREGLERLCNLSDKYDRDRHVLLSVSQIRANRRELVPKPRLAFLGPLGTYSHQAVFECFGNAVEFLPRSTITDVQQALSATVPFGVIPQENSTNGSVVETYNVLRIPVIGQKTFVRGVTVFGVKHSLVTRRGVKMGDIESVLSHEQALGQCRVWLGKHLPRASLVPTDSTASAAKRLLSAENGLDPMKCAAICSSVVITIYEGLEILEEGIQDGRDNFTRFYILSHGQDIALPKECSLSTENMALLRFQAPPGDPVQPIPNISRIITTLGVIVLRIDRRPTLYGRPFDDVYFLEVGAIPEQSGPEQSWTKQLEQAVGKVRCMGVEVSILGCW